MSNFFSSLFGKKKTVRIDFIDLDQKRESLQSKILSGKKGQTYDYQPQAAIKELEQKGYQLAENGFTKAKRIFPANNVRYTISFHHRIETVDRDHLRSRFSRNQVEKKIQQVVHYQGAGSRTPQDNTSTVTFWRKLKVDAVTGQIKQTGSWQPEQKTFLKIGVPIVPGFFPSQTSVGGKTVKAEDEDQVYTVTFQLNKEPSGKEQMAEVDYVDLAHHNELVKKVSLAGQPNFPINYDPAPTLKLLASAGYSLISNNLADVQFFGNKDGYVPVLIVTLKQEAVVVNEKHPDARIKEEEYQRQVCFEVNFVGAEDQTPRPIKQVANWSRTIAINPENGQIIVHSKFNTPWQSDRQKYEAIKVPVVNHYHSSRTQIAAPPLDRQNHRQTVTYRHNGKFIPVIASGTAIPLSKPLYLQTDPTDASKVAINQPVPQIKGFHASLKQVAPTEANHDLQLIYEPDADNQEWQDKLARQTVLQNQAQQVAVVNFIDLDHHGKQLTSSGPLLGRAGEKINDLYSTALPLKGFRQAGYHVVFNDFDGQGAVQRFSGNHLMTQVFTVGLRKGDARMQLQRMTTRATDLIKEQQNKMVMSTQLSRTLINLMSSLMDLILLLNHNEENKKVRSDHKKTE